MKAEQRGMKIIGEPWHIESPVDVTDPCYDRDAWCRINGLQVVPGEYTCAIAEEDTGMWGIRVSTIGIYLDGDVPATSEMDAIGDIGVDAGLAGFFVNKPDFTDVEWGAFCNQISSGRAWQFTYGFCSSSGYGDGAYNVFARMNSAGAINALEIRFLD